MRMYHLAYMWKCRGEFFSLKSLELVSRQKFLQKFNFFPLDTKIDCRKGDGKGGNEKLIRGKYTVQECVTEVKNFNWVVEQQVASHQIYGNCTICRFGFRTKQCYCKDRAN